MVIVHRTIGSYLVEPVGSVRSITMGVDLHISSPFVIAVPTCTTVDPADSDPNCDELSTVVADRTGCEECPCSFALLSSPGNTRQVTHSNFFGQPA